MKIIIASKNKGKIKEFQTLMPNYIAILGELDYKIKKSLVTVQKL
jgi:inosine/xanthosine triphosphate pyrophosphatase family protein